MHDTENFRFIGKNKIIHLTINENRLLDLLIQNKGKVATYEKICEILYNSKIDESFKLGIYVFISRLRKKLKGEVEIIARCQFGYIIL